MKFIRNCVQKAEYHHSGGCDTEKLTASDGHRYKKTEHGKQRKMSRFPNDKGCLVKYGKLLFLWKVFEIVNNNMNGGISKFHAGF